MFYDATLHISLDLQDSLGRLADVHAIEAAQSDTVAWEALPKSCVPPKLPWTSMLKGIVVGSDICVLHLAESARQRSAMQRANGAQLLHTCVGQVLSLR